MKKVLREKRPKNKMLTRNAERRKKRDCENLIIIVAVERVQMDCYGSTTTEVAARRLVPRYRISWRPRMRNSTTRMSEVYGESRATIRDGEHEVFDRVGESATAAAALLSR